MPTVKARISEQPAARTGEFWFQRPPNCVRIVDSGQLALSLASQVVDLLREVLSRNPYAIITTSAGRTLRPTYAVLRDSFAAALDWTRVVCVQMDEYEGMGSADPRSTASELLREFVGPLGIKRFIRFYDDTGTASCSLDQFEQQVSALGGIDCAIHGVGRNGHIGFNEPGTSEELSTRAVALAESTRIANGVAFQRGVTLGLGILRAARVSLVVLRGIEKCGAAEALLFGPVGPQNPVAYLRSCHRVMVYLDRAAAPKAYSALSAMDIAAGS